MHINNASPRSHSISRSELNHLAHQAHDPLPLLTANSPAPQQPSKRLPFAAPLPSLPNDDLRPTSHLRKAGKSWNQASPALASMILSSPHLRGSKSGDGDRASRALHYYDHRHVDGDGAATRDAIILAKRARSCVLHASRRSSRWKSWLRIVMDDASSICTQFRC